MQNNRRKRPTFGMGSDCSARGTQASYSQSIEGFLGPVHVGRSYLGSRENISTGQIMFCSYVEMFSRLPDKVSRGDVDFVKCRQKVFPLSGKVVFIWDKNYLGHQDLACHQARSRLTGKLFVSHERKVTFHTIFIRR